MMQVKHICVCGGGTMGIGIAQATATVGYTVLVYEIQESVVERAQAQLKKNLQQLVDKGKMDATTRNSVAERISFSTAIDDCRADLVIEAVVENMGIKASLFQSLEAINGPDTLLCSNTSSISITELSRRLQHPRRFAGLHFFNPATLMKLVEIVTAPDTSNAALQTLVVFTESLGKTPVVCKDAPGFIVNRVARPFYIESLRLVEEGPGHPALVDALLEDRGFRLGPFRLMDLIGNDVNYAVSCSVYEQLQQPERLRPSPLQKEKVDTGALGKKSGKGYYEY